MRYWRKAVLWDDVELTTRVYGNSLRMLAKCLNFQQLVTPGPVAKQIGESINGEAESPENVQRDRSCIDAACSPLRGSESLMPIKELTGERFFGGWNEEDTTEILTNWSTSTSTVEWLMSGVPTWQNYGLVVCVRRESSSGTVELVR